MLRAALIGLPATGKTTLFQLMTAVREPPRADAATCRSASRKCPTRGSIASPRCSTRGSGCLRRWSSRTLAAREPPAARSRSSIVVAYKNADALVHVVRAFQDEAMPHVSGRVNPARDAQAMEDELILADLGVAERRLERLDKDLKKTKTAELERKRR